MRSQKSIEKRLFEVAHTDDPCRYAVYACVKIVEGKEGAVKRVAAYDFLGDLARFVVEKHDMVAVPAHTARNVQRDVVCEEQH